MENWQNTVWYLAKQMGCQQLLFMFLDLHTFRYRRFLKSHVPISGIGTQMCWLAALPGSIVTCFSCFSR